MNLIPEVSEIWRYPVKACAGESLPTIQIGAGGVEGDRGYMIVDVQNKHVNQITASQTEILATVKPMLIPNGIILSAPNINQIEFKDQMYKQLTVDVYGTSCLAYDMGNIAAEWFSELLNGNYRFVKQASPRQKEKTPKGRNKPLQFEVNFADGYPFLITNTASLEDLNQRILCNSGTLVPMNRFRPNIVISGTDEWAEDEWRTIQVGELELQIIKACVRCAITTIDQKQGNKCGIEPLKTLATFRKLEGSSGVLFGVYATGINNGIIKLGDRVEIF